MSMSHGNQPFLALVDDDSHSARLMIRMLLAHGAPSVSWLNGDASAEAELATLLDNGVAAPPGMVIVDLKSSSSATSEFIARLGAREHVHRTLIAAMASSLEREVREGLLAVGADAVFQRCAGIEPYREEARAIVGFWVRNQRLDAVGT